MQEGHPFPRGRIGFAVGGWSPGSRDYLAAPSRRLVVASGLAAVASPVTVAGPRRGFTGFPSPSNLNATESTAIRAARVGVCPDPVQCSVGKVACTERFHWWMPGADAGPDVYW